MVARSRLDAPAMTTSANHIRGVMLAGPSGAGKTTLARKLHDELRIPPVSFGDVVRAVAPPDATRETLEQVGQQLIGQGWKPFCEAVLSRTPQDAVIVSIDGIRHLAAVQTLRELLHPRSLLIYVSASPPQVRRRTADRPASRQPVPHSQMDREATQLTAIADLVLPRDWTPGSAVSSIRKALEITPPRPRP
jgi:dephospho-CoA kinase